jgi:predicted Rossmann-fold nucleotide-binding protein
MDYSACVGLYQKPGCGTKPVLSGDRGGAMQLVVFGVLIAGMAVIGIRIARGIRARDKARDPTE